MRDGTEADGSYLSGWYRNESGYAIEVVVYRNDGPSSRVRLEAGERVAIPSGVRQVELWIPRTGFLVSHPRLVRMNGDELHTDFLQPEVIEALVPWDFIRWMQSQRVHLKLGIRSTQLRRATVSEDGPDYATLVQLVRETGHRGEIAIDIDTAMNQDRLRATLELFRTLLTEEPDAMLRFGISNEVWNMIFEGSKELERRFGGFWEAMDAVGALTAQLKALCLEVFGEDEDRVKVVLEGNQHVTPDKGPDEDPEGYSQWDLIERMNTAAQQESFRLLGNANALPDQVAINGYLYAEGTTVEEITNELPAKLTKWLERVKEVMGSLYAGQEVIVYELNLHSPDAGTWQNVEDISDAIIEWCYTSECFDFFLDWLHQCDDIGIASVALFCTEREPKTNDPKGVTQFGISHGLVSERDSRWDAAMSYLNDDPIDDPIDPIDEPPVVSPSKGQQLIALLQEVRLHHKQVAHNLGEAAAEAEDVARTFDEILELLDIPDTE